MNTDYEVPRAFLKGKFELEDNRGDAWSQVEGDDLRVCMHLMGPYSKQVELLKWEYSQSQSAWRTLAYSPDYTEWKETMKKLEAANSIKDANDPKLFCGFTDNFSFVNNAKNPGNNGIFVGDGTYNSAEKKATVEWKREFDVLDSSDTLTLVTNQKF